MAQLGWWTLVTEGVELQDLTDETREHIADMIREGNIEGQIMQDDEDEEESQAPSRPVNWPDRIGD